ncbi:MAG: hypothetical protein AAB567_02190 [Patescibacteria group bacterium]
MHGKLFIFFILLAAGVGAVGFWFWQKNSISREVLKLEILAPEEVTMADEITYLVKWKNNGDMTLENVRLIFEYPEGSLSSQDPSLRVTKSVEDIYPGQEGSLRFPTRLFGKERETKEAKVLVTYTLKNLSATFRAETTRTTVIFFVPLNFELDTPSRMESGQEFDFVLNYFSNSEYPLSNLRIQLKYPEGFKFKKATPSPIGESEWDIGALNRAEGGRITITGVLEGGVQEAKLFHAILGSWNEGKFTLLKEVRKAVQITEPKLSIAQTINSSAQYTASPGDTLHYEISFRNLSEKVLENLFLVVALEGRGFDLESVKVEKGKFQRGDNSIIWEARDVPKLRFLGRGEEGKVEFWVDAKEDIQTFSPQDKNFVLRDRVLLSDVKEEFEVKIHARIGIDQKGFFRDEVFGNQGPVPPKVGEKTTYTITWQAKNLYNDVRNAKVKAILPQNVELTSNIFPENAALTFDSVSRELVWEIGDLPAGTGAFETLLSPSLSFQIGFTPVDSSRGSKPEIIKEATITGEDTFTEQVVSSTDIPIDTTLPDDEGVTDEMGVVQ